MNYDYRPVAIGFCGARHFSDGINGHLGDAGIGHCLGHGGRVAARFAGGAMLRLAICLTQFIGSAGAVCDVTRRSARNVVNRFVVRCRNR